MLKYIIKYFKISKLFYNDKKIITISIFLIGENHLKKEYQKFKAILVPIKILEIGHWKNFP
jgi:hypothetical protein